MECREPSVGVVLLRRGQGLDRARQVLGSEQAGKPLVERGQDQVLAAVDLERVLKVLAECVLSWVTAAVVRPVVDQWPCILRLQTLHVRWRQLAGYPRFVSDGWLG